MTLNKKQREERAQLKAFLALPHTPEAHAIALYAQRLERRLDELRKKFENAQAHFDDDMALGYEREKSFEAGASFRWESESLAFRTALKVMDLDAEAILQRYLPGARSFLLVTDPAYGGNFPVVANKAAADPLAVLIHTTEMDMIDG